jgi:pseudomonalisin
MTPFRWLIIFFLFFSAIISIEQRLNAQTLASERVTAPVDDRATVARPGNRHPLARAEYDAGIASPGHRMDRMMLVLEPDAAQQHALQALLQAQQDPQSPQYHQWLTPEAFGKLFGVSGHDLDQVVNWLTRHGFEVEPVSSGRRVVLFSGTAAQVEAAFHTQVHVYNVNGERHYANSTDPEIPLALAGVVHGIASLHDFRAMPLHQGLEPLAAAAPQYSSGGTHYMAPVDFATIYDVAALYSSSIDGTGQSIAIVGRSNFTAADVPKFRSTFGLPANSPTVVLNGPNPGVVSSDEQTEAELDVQWSGAVAKNAAIQFVLSGSTSTTDGVLLSSEYVVSHNLAPVMSMSFGLCEAAMGTSQNQLWNSLWQQAAAQGITVLVSSGDSGAAGCDSPSTSRAVSGSAVNGLCSSAYSTCVGGTQFNDAANASLYWAATTDPTTYGSALSYIPEAAWNASAGTTGGSGLWSSGGGASGIYPKPAWQAGTGVPPDGRRDVPDVSLNAAIHDGYLFYLNGQLYLVGGTSAAAPAFAGLMALAVQRAGSRQGNINPTLYGLAANQWNGGTAVFHDVTAGNNSVPGVVGSNAGAGYDLATGLGSVDALLLVNHWADATTPSPTTPGFQFIGSQPSLALAPGTSSAIQVNVSVSGGFSSAVSLTPGALPAGLTASLSPSSFPAPGSGSSTLTLNATAGAAGGAYNLSLLASGGGINQPLALAVTIQSNCTYAINPTSATPGAAGGNFMATVTAQSGCTWAASSQVSWITVTSGASGSGNGTLMYSVAANSSTAPRAGSLSIAGLMLAVTEAGAAPVASPLNPSSATFSSAGGSGSVTVTPPQPNASWTATSNVYWIRITSGATSAARNKTVNYSVTANSAASARTGTVVIAGSIFTVTQAAACVYTVSLGKMTAAPGGFNGTVAVSTAAACTWSGASSVTWITVTSGNPGNGPGTLGFFVASNPKSASRIGTLTVAKHAIQITEGAKGAVQYGQPVP